MAVTVILKNGTRIEVVTGAAVTATTLPAAPGCTPGTALAVVTPSGHPVAVFRVSEVAGYDLSAASTGA